MRCSCSSRTSCPVIGTLAIAGHKREPLYCNQLNGIENPGVVDHAGAWYYQCVELANRWLVDGLGAPRIPGNAKEMCGNADRRSFRVYRRGTDYIPVAGDLLVWDGSTHGHVGVVASVSRTSLVVANQNYGNNGLQSPFVSAPREDGFFGSPHGSARLTASCIIHPKVLHASSSPPSRRGFDPPR